MKRTKLLGAATSLAVITLIQGCAITPQRAANLTPIDLCERYYFGVGSDKTKRVIYEEVQRRSLDCNQYKDVLTARQNQRDAANAAFVQGLLGTSALINATNPQPSTQQQIIVQPAPAPLPPVNIQPPSFPKVCPTLNSCR